MDCTAADPTRIVASTAPLGTGRPPGSGQLEQAVRNYGPRITKAEDVSGSGADCGRDNGLGKERSLRRACGGVDMAAVTRHTAAQDRGGTDSDEEYVTTSFE